MSNDTGVPNGTIFFAVCVFFLVNSIFGRYRTNDILDAIESTCTIVATVEDGK